MKKLIAFLIIVLHSCSSSDDGSTSNPEASTFQVTVTQNITAVIDEIATLTANANETINEISFSTNGGATFPLTSSRDFGNTANLYFDFETLGAKTIIFRVQNNAGDIVDNTVTINVERGNAIKLNSLQLNSFFDIGNTWDAEFPTTNPNHLADVFFVLLKQRLNVFDGTRNGFSNNNLWYRSETRDNEVNLFWNLQNEEIYVDLDVLNPFIAFADEDEGNAVGDLMLGPPFQRLIPLSDFVNTEPSTILVEETDINLEYEVGVDW